MAVASKDEFVACLRKSNILTPKKLEAVLERYPTEDLKVFASKLVHDETLTHWQAKVLYSGRSKLRLGNYILLERLKTDEMGDRFRATHQSLQRPVEIQLLPKKVSENVHLQNSFVGNVGLISELDHPNITHIQDVDREGPQFYLVDEAHDGTKLAEANLSPDELIHCTHQILQALAFAHGQSVIHGEVNAENIVRINPSLFKICGMGLSLVRRKLTGLTEATARDDLADLAAVLNKQFATFTPEQQTLHSWLGKGLTRLQEDPIAYYPRLLVAAENHLEQSANAPSSPRAESEDGQDQPTFPDDQVANSVVENSKDVESSIPATNAMDADSHAPSGLASSTDALNQTRETNSDKKAKFDQTPASSLFANPLTLSAVALVALAILTGGGLYFGGFFSSPKETAANTPELSIKRNQVVRPSLTASSGPGPEVTKTQPAEANTASVTERDNETAESTNTSPSTLVRKPSVTPEIEKSSTSTANSSPNTPEEKTAQTDPPLVQDKESKKASTTDAKKTDDDLAEKSESATTEPDPSTTQDPELLAFVPEYVGLPNSDIKEAFLISEIAEGESLDSVSIVSDPTAFSNGKGILSTKPIDDSHWNVIFQNKAGGAEEIVAQLEIAENELTFAWGAEVSKKSKANAIRNCILQLQSGATTKEVFLREPVLLDIKLTEKEYSQNLRTNIQWLPQKDYVRIEVAKPTEPWPDDLFTFEGEFVDPFLFDETKPTLPIFFAEDSDEQHLSVVIKPVVNKTISFQMAVFAKGKETASVQYDSYESAEEATELLSRAKQAKFVERQQAELAAQNAPYGQRGKTRDAATAVRKAYKLIGDNLEISNDIREQLRELHDAPLPVTVYYELNGRRVIIAHSSND